MERPAITALTAQLKRHLDPSKSRLETLALLTVGMIGSRTVNLVHIADKRGPTTVDPAPTCRRLQRFFLHVRLEEDWAAPLLAGVAGGAEKRTLIIDRTNWKVGETNINLFVLAVRTRHSQVPLMGTVLATDRRRRPGRRLVGPGRKNRPGPNAKDPRLPRQILFPNRLHTAAKLLRRNDPKIVIEWVRLKIAGILTRVVESEFQVNEKR